VICDLLLVCQTAMGDQPGRGLWSRNLPVFCSAMMNRLRSSAVTDEISGSPPGNLPKYPTLEVTQPIVQGLLPSVRAQIL